MDNRYIEMSPELIGAIAAADKRIGEAHDRLCAAEAERSALLVEAAAAITEFKVGDDALKGNQRYRITKVVAEPLSVKGITPKLHVTYHGQRLKKDGTPTGRERWLYDIKPITEAQSK